MGHVLPPLWVQRIKRAKDVSSSLLLLSSQSSCSRWARGALLAPCVLWQSQSLSLCCCWKGLLGCLFSPLQRRTGLCALETVFQQSLTFAFDCLGFKRSCYLIHPRNDLSTWGNIVHKWPVLNPVWPASGWTTVSCHISFDSQRLYVFLDFLLSLYLGEKPICLTTPSLVLLSFKLFF